MNDTIVDSENALLSRARQWDKQALTEIYDLFSHRLYRYALRLLGSPVVAEECVAETFERFLVALQKGGGPQEHLQAYLYRVAHNWVTDFYRRSVNSDLSLDPELETPGHDLGTPQGSDPGAEDWEAQILKNALVSLPPDQRQVIVLKYMEGWQNEQISLAISRTVGAVKALQHRGLTNLQKMLNKQDTND